MPILEWIRKQEPPAKKLEEKILERQKYIGFELGRAQIELKKAVSQCELENAKKKESSIFATKKMQRLNKEADMNQQMIKVQYIHDIFCFSF